MYQQLADGTLCFDDPHHPAMGPAGYPPDGRFDDGFGCDDPEKILAAIERSMSYSHAPVKIETVELTRRLHHARHAVDEREIDTLRNATSLLEWRNYAHRKLVFELRAVIYGKSHPKKHLIRFPADWWQAVKERFAPAWFLDRHPVKFTEVSASLEETYPEVTPALPDQREVMLFRVHRRDDFPRW